MNKKGLTNILPNYINRHCHRKYEKLKLITQGYFLLVTHPITNPARQGLIHKESNLDCSLPCRRHAITVLIIFLKKSRTNQFNGDKYKKCQIG